MRALVTTLLLAPLCACAGGSKDSPAEEAPIDAGSAPTPVPVDAASALLAPPPLTGTHLDPGDSSYRPRGTTGVRPTARTIELVLRSTPPGSQASIDGQLIGSTPAFWSGPADGKSHEFTFVKEGYAMARYRFVATQNGVVHGTLKRLEPGISEDAGPR